MDDRERETLRRLWHLSMHSRCPIWLGGQMQQIVEDALGVDSAGAVEEALAIEVVELTAEDVAEIRARERAMMS
jgi:hypothetical protein